MNKQEFCGTDSFGTFIQREAPVNDFKTNEDHDAKQNSFNQNETTNEPVKVELIDDNEHHEDEGTLRPGSMSDNLKSNQIQSQEQADSLGNQGQRQKALHDSFGVGMVGESQDKSGGPDQTKFGNDSLVQVEPNLKDQLSNLSKDNKIQSQIQKTSVEQQVKNKNINKQDKNSFSELSMAATNPNNKGLSAVSKGLQPDNVMGSFGSIPAQPNTNDQNQKPSVHIENSKDNEDEAKKEEKTAEKKNRHHDKKRNKSGKKGSVKKTKSIGHYTLGKTLGEGTFGKVQLGVHNLTGEKVAVKILEKHRIEEAVDIERVTREIKILKMARHPNVGQLYEYIETPKQLYLILEYVSKGELFDYIVKKKKLKEQQACNFFQQIISGIQYLKELGIVHRDMKPENLLLDHNGQIKIVDFGLSNTYKKDQTLKTACGSPCYAAPEMIAGNEYHGARVDVWSCGVILFAMVCGYLPFEDPDTDKLYQKILNGKFEIPEWVSEPCKDLINKILENDPDKRLDTNQIMKHEWYVTQNTPVIKNVGLIIGKNKIPLESTIVQMLKQYGFNQADAEKCLNRNRHNQVTTIYYLLHKRYVMDGKLPCHFNIVNKAGSGYASNNPVTSPKIDDGNFKIGIPKNEDDYSPVKKITVDKDVSQKSLNRSPRSPNIVFNKSESKEGVGMNSQKEIELSVSPVKKGRRMIDEGDKLDGPDFSIKPGGLNLKETDVFSPVGQMPDNYESFNIYNENKEQKNEEKGSRSPNKKRRRAFAQGLSSDESAGTNPQVKIGQGLQIKMQDLSGTSGDQNQTEDNDSKEFEKTQDVGDNTGSSISYKGEGERIILITNQGVNRNTNQTNTLQNKVEQNIKIGDGELKVPTPNTIFSPKDQMQNSDKKQAERINLKFGRTLKQNTEEPAPIVSQGEREYQQKIKAYTKDNYKYRQKEKGRSIDEKQKTKALIRNIEKILNKGILKGVSKEKKPNAAETYQTQVQSNSRQLPPQVPKTTTAAAYESSSKQQVINVRRQNRRASSIECVVELQIYNNKTEQQPGRTGDYDDTTNYKEQITSKSGLDKLQGDSRMHSTQNNGAQSYSFQRDSFNTAVKPYTTTENKTEQDSSYHQTPINFYDGPNLQQQNQQFNNSQNPDNSSQLISSNQMRPPLHNGQQNIQEATQQIRERQQLMNQKHVFSESPNRERYNPLFGNFMAHPNQMTSGSFKDNNYQFPSGNPLMYQQHLKNGGIPSNTYQFQQNQFDASPNMNYVDRLNNSQERELSTNSMGNEQAQFRTAPQRARQTFKRYPEGGRQHTSGTNTAQGYRTRMMNRLISTQKEEQTDTKSQAVEQSFTEATPYKARPNPRRVSNQRVTSKALNGNTIKHANTVKPYTQRRINVSDRQPQINNQDFQGSQFQNMRQDPINFTNQYNIYCHLNDFQKYPWRYNPVLGQQLQSPTPLGASANLPNSSSLPGNLGATSPSPFMQTGELTNPLLSTELQNPLIAQYLNLINQPTADPAQLMEYQYQNSLLKLNLQNQISMMQQQQLTQQLAALGIMPSLGLQQSPIIDGSNPSLMQISPAAAQFRNLNNQPQMQAQSAAAMFGLQQLQQQQSASSQPNNQQQDQSAFNQFQQQQISQSMSPPKKFRSKMGPSSRQQQQVVPPGGLRHPSPYDSSINQSAIAQANSSFYDHGDSAGLNQSSGTTFTRNIGSRRSNNNTIGRQEDSIDSKPGKGQDYQMVTGQTILSQNQQNTTNLPPKIGNGGQLGQPTVANANDGSEGPKVEKD